MTGAASGTTWDCPDERRDIAPASVVANSSGSCVALRLAAERPELVARMVCHEPPLLGLLEASPERRVADGEWRKLARVRPRLEQGDYAGGAEYFVEQVALGPGAWEQLPPPVREQIIRYAPTFLGELCDRDILRADVDSLRQVIAPVLITEGDCSPRAHGAVIDLLARMLPDMRRESLLGAGHVPHLTHPDEYAKVVKWFLQDG